MLIQELLFGLRDAAVEKMSVLRAVAPLLSTTPLQYGRFNHWRVSDAPVFVMIRLQLAEYLVP